MNRNEQNDICCPQDVGHVQWVEGEGRAESCLTTHHLLGGGGAKPPPPRSDPDFIVGKNEIYKRKY